MTKVTKVNPALSGMPKVDRIKKKELAQYLGVIAHGFPRFEDAACGARESSMFVGKCTYRYLLSCYNLRDQSFQMSFLLSPPFVKGGICGSIISGTYENFSLSKKK